MGQCNSPDAHCFFLTHVICFTFNFDSCLVFHVVLVKKKSARMRECEIASMCVNVRVPFRERGRECEGASARATV